MGDVHVWPAGTPVPSTQLKSEAMGVPDGGIVVWSLILPLLLATAAGSRACCTPWIRNVVPLTVTVKPTSTTVSRAPPPPPPAVDWEKEPAGTPVNRRPLAPLAVTMPVTSTLADVSAPPMMFALKLLKTRSPWVTVPFEAMMTSRVVARTAGANAMAISAIPGASQPVLFLAIARLSLQIAEVEIGASLFFVLIAFLLTP